MPNRRIANLAGFLACAGLMAYALYAQHVMGLEPCPLCIFQRIGVISLGLVFLIAGLHNPKTWGRFVYAALIGVAALAILGVAGRHMYIQTLPPGAVPSCGAPLSVLYQFTPVVDLVKKVLMGGGECQQIDWLFLGLPMPAWVFICGVALGAWGLYANLRRPATGTLTFATRT